MQDYERFTLCMIIVSHSTSIFVKFHIFSFLLEQNKATEIKLNEQVLEKVNTFTYLWSNMAQDGDVTNEILTCLVLVTNAFKKTFKYIASTQIIQEYKTWTT